MARLVIDGGRRLTGSVVLAGAKNSSFKLMIAGLLADGTTRLNNVARIDEVRHTASMIGSLGGRAETGPGRTVRVAGRGLSSWKIPAELGRFSRASTLFLGPLLARFGRAVVPLPGGDAIGRRPLDRHWQGLRSLGAELIESGGMIEARAKSWHGGQYTFPKNSHTGTETLLLAAVSAPGRTVLSRAAAEPEVDDLIVLLGKMGANIRRRGRTIVIDGGKPLRPAVHPVMPDRNQAVSYAVAALATGGEVRVQNARHQDLTVFLEQLKRAGAGVEIGREAIRFYHKNQLRLVGITTRPHPGFMSDWQPLWSVLMTQAAGRAKIIEAVFLNRFQFVPDLIAMGARIDYFRPRPENPDRFYNFNLSDDRPDNRHGIIVSGPTPLKGGRFAVRDIRNGATLTIAGLVASGRTILEQAELIDRGYEDFSGQLLRLGAKIKKVG